MAKVDKKNVKYPKKCAEAEFALKMQVELMMREMGIDLEEEKETETEEE